MQFIIITCILFSALYSSPIQNESYSNGSYITGEDGVIRMYVNIMGHVKSPGSYLVYDGIDFLSALSMAGGYLQGSKLSTVMIYTSEGGKKIINLNNYLNDSAKLIKLNPHDTIYIEQKTISKILTSSNIPSIILGILSVALTIERTD